MYPSLTIRSLPPNLGKSITPKIRIFDFLILKFSVKSSAQAIAVPPVATKSSTMTTLSELLKVVFFWISIEVLPYSKSKSFLNVSLGSFPGFLARTKGSPSSKEIEPAKIKPLLSMLAMTEALKFL